MARSSSPRTKKLQMFNVQVEPEATPQAVAINGIKGMDTVSPITAMPEGTVRLIRNLAWREGAYETRDGTSVFGSASTTPIVGFADSFTVANLSRIARFRTNGVDTFQSGDWVAATGDVFKMYASSPLARTAWADSILFSGGIGGLYKLDFTNPAVVTKIPDTPSGIRHLASFNKRVIASLDDRIQWTVNGDSEDWAGLGSGFEDLRAAPAGRTDSQTAVVPVTDEVALVVRTNSVWQMSPTGNFDAPFRFSRLFGQIGSRYPETVVEIPQGTIFLGDRAVWMVTLQGFEDIGAPIRDLLDEDQSILRLATAAFDEKWREYRLSLGNRVLRYSMITGGWTEDIYPFNIRSLYYTRFYQNLTVDELTGTVDALEGAVDDLGIGNRRGSFIYAQSGSGRLVIKDDSTRNNEVDRDVNGVGVTTSMDFRVETGNMQLSRLHRTVHHETQIEYESEDETSLLIEYSTTGGDVWAILGYQTLALTDKPTLAAVTRYFERATFQLAISCTSVPSFRLSGAFAFLSRGARITDAR